MTLTHGRVACAEGTGKEMSHELVGKGFLHACVEEHVREASDSLVLTCRGSIALNEHLRMGQSVGKQHLMAVCSCFIFTHETASRAIRMLVRTGESS